MLQRPFEKVMAANRGEIAIRIFRACYDLDIRTLAIYSKEDTMNLFRTKADEAYLIGEHLSPLGAYLAIDEIIALAKKRGVDAIHPGYGFLSENAAFAKACEDAGHKVHRPPEQRARQDGRQARGQEDSRGLRRARHPRHARAAEGRRRGAGQGQASSASPSSSRPPRAAAGAACASARSPRTWPRPSSWSRTRRARPSATTASSWRSTSSSPSTSRCRSSPTSTACVRHLGERDCSLQRRYQKVVEFAPAWSVAPEVREKLHADAVKIAEAVRYVNAGTVEFLVDKSGNHYFIEMNPRIQVEHTVTEMVTGIDIVRAQILIAGGAPLSHPEIGLAKQSDLRVDGYSIQCRVTTEDPKNNFAPDNGKIVSYRSGGGFGVRLDGGNAAAGAEISPYYDSLLVKVTSWDRTFEAVCRKARRAINEEHVRGVKTNISFVTNILNHPTFINGKCHTKFIDETPELFDIEESRDRATRVLRYIANLQVQNPDAERREYPAPRYPKPAREVTAEMGLKHLLDTKGPEAVSKWVLEQKKLLVTDTTMRDAHQSLLSTRMRTRDMVKGAEGTADVLADCFSLEMWGGATFDTAYRFLYESPWERLDHAAREDPEHPLPDAPARL